MQGKKIDLFFNGDYVCSTMKSKTCKEAKVNLLERYADNIARFGSWSLVESQVLKYPHLLKARFSKC